jgi:hypothetical protein
MGRRGTAGFQSEALLVILAYPETLAIVLVYCTVHAKI